MANQEHVKWLKEGVEAWNKRRERENFSPDLSRAYLGRANLSGADFSYSNLRNADLRITDLSGANFSHADLRDANLLGVDLSNAHLSFADLSSAVLLDANLRGATLALTNLSDAYLISANLSGTHLMSADLSGTRLSHSELWKAKLYAPPEDSGTTHGTIQGTEDEVQENKRKKIKSIECLLQECRGLRDKYRDDILFYFRGESRTSRELRPSVMRSSPEGQFPLRAWEGEMLLDLMSRQPEAFSGLNLAIDQWVLAQHHGLKTRLLDITRNPLVALFNVCKKYDTQDGSDSRDGCLHVFAVPRDIIKPFNSDTISIIANFSKLRRDEQNLLLGKKRPGLHDPLDLEDEPIADNYDQVMGRLYNFIWREKPSFQEKIDPKDLFRVFVVEPQRSFERLQTQSGAFLISAFHERFERDEILKWNEGTPVYDHYTLGVSGESKKYIMDELRLLNITHESLFPGIDEAAKAVIQRYSTERSENS